MENCVALYTLGYQQRSVAEFTKILKDSNINVLIDVRETYLRPTTNA